MYLQCDEKKFRWLKLIKFLSLTRMEYKHSIDDHLLQLGKISFNL